MFAYLQQNKVETFEIEISQHSMKNKHLKLKHIILIFHAKKPRFERTKNQIIRFAIIKDRLFLPI